MRKCNFEPGVVKIEFSQWQYTPTRLASNRREFCRLKYDYGATGWAI